ncbi:jg16123 [Pararge aegeria aegeria]|uniref:Jg16123 protein n=1 Tax=Pararge aegeria aegeria TaxID=348720 RepID=A0A8S4RE57_9NEOP|nr:jg16123 [Pararge aegeria aegeria]
MGHIRRHRVTQRAMDRAMFGIWYTDKCMDSKVLEWHHTGKRSFGRSSTRWTDDIKRVARSRWTQAAEDRDIRNSLYKSSSRCPLVQIEKECERIGAHGITAQQLSSKCLKIINSKMGSGYSSANSRKWSKKEAPNPESSRILFLLYLIHRTWNVVVEHMDSKSGRWRGSHTVPSSGEGLRHFDSVSLDSGGSCYSACSCSYCRLRDCAQDCISHLHHDDTDAGLPSSWLYKPPVSIRSIVSELSLAWRPVLSVKISLASSVKENIVRKLACLRVLHNALTGQLSINCVESTNPQWASVVDPPRC